MPNIAPERLDRCNEPRAVANNRAVSGIARGAAETDSREVALGIHVVVGEFQASVVAIQKVHGSLPIWSVRIAEDSAFNVLAASLVWSALLPSRWRNQHWLKLTSFVVAILATLAAAYMVCRDLFDERITHCVAAALKCGMLAVFLLVRTDATAEKKIR